MKTMINWKNDKSDLIKSVLICLSLITTGCGVSLLGATLIDLEISANSSKSQSSFIIAARAVGYAIGSISGGFLGDNIPIVWIPIGSLILVGFSNLFLPWMRSFWTLTPWLGLSGFGLGNLEVSANVWLINIWTNKWPPMIYSTSFSYGFGTLLAPLLAQSFLIDFVPTSSNDVTLNGTTNESYQNPDELSLHYAFETFAFFCLLLDVLFIALILKDKPIREEKLVKTSECSSRDKLPFTPKLILKILILLLSHSGAGLNMGFGLLLLSYSVQSDLKFTKSQGALLSSAYWTVYSFGRIFAFVLMNFMSNRSLMYVHLTLTLIAGTNLYLTYPSTIGLAFSVLLMGVGLSPFTPLVFFNVKKYLHLSGHLTSIIIVGTIIGESIYPPLIAHIAIASDNPIAFSYICIALSLSTFCFFTSFQLIGRKFQPKFINRSQVQDEIEDKQCKSLIVTLS